MTKEDFLNQLKKKIAELPSRDAEKFIDYYSEMIEDRIEDGIPEETAVADLGGVDDVASQILSDISQTEKKQGRFRVWEIVLIVLGSPVWIMLLLAAVMILIAVYLVIWSLVLAAWSVTFAFAAASVGCLVRSISVLFLPDCFQFMIYLGLALIFGGLSVPMFLGVQKFSLLIVRVSKNIIVGIKSLFLRRNGK